MQRFSNFSNRSGSAGFIGRTALAVVIGCFGMLGASSARANDVHNFIDLDGGTNFYGALHSDNDDFVDTFTLDIDDLLNVSVSLITIGSGGNNIDFSSADLNGIALTLTENGFLESGFLADTVFSGGPLILTIRGSSDAADGVFASYSGTINVAIIPEPSTALMMGLGLVGLGFGARRARA